MPSPSDALAPSSRHAFIHEGRVIYEWDQTFNEVNIYITVPPGLSSRDLFCTISSKHIRIGITGNPPYMDQDFGGMAKASESFWTLEDGTLHVSIEKGQEGETWQSALQGHELDTLTAQEDQKRLLLERFQNEHPGFDFSQAVVNGEAPNARTFLKQ